MVQARSDLPKTKHGADIPSPCFLAITKLGWDRRAWASSSIEPECCRQVWDREVGIKQKPTGPSRAGSR